jgi:hypothetical protein
MHHPLALGHTIFVARNLNHKRPFSRRNTLSQHTRKNRVQINQAPLRWLYPRKCINKSICWHPEGTRGVPMEGAPPVANQIDLFMYFLGASRNGLVARRVDLDTISSSDNLRGALNVACMHKRDIIGAYGFQNIHKVHVFFILAL